MLTIRFDGPPGPEAGRFVEAEINGLSANVGNWRQDGEYWLLDIIFVANLERQLSDLRCKLRDAQYGLIQTFDCSYCGSNRSTGFPDCCNAAADEYFYLKRKLEDNDD